MKGRELRQHLRERRRDLRLRLKERQQAARERLNANPAVRRARDQRRRRRLLTVMLILLAILLVSRCDCSEPAPPPTPVEPLAPPPAPKPPPKVELKPRPKAKPPIRQAGTTVARPSFDGENHPPPSWLDAFRLQVAARGPRLARCFDGAEKPGALRWTASVNAGSGAVSDHVLEPLGNGGSLLEKQRECVVGVLSSPPYRLGKGEQALPERVSIAVEF